MIAEGASRVLNICRTEAENRGQTIKEKNRRQRDDGKGKREEAENREQRAKSRVQTAEDREQTKKGEFS